MSEHKPKDFLNLLSGGGTGKFRGGKSSNATSALPNDERLETAAFECLLAGLDDNRVTSLLHLLDWPDDFKCFCIAGLPKSSFATARSTIRRKVQDLGGKLCLIGHHEGLCIALIVTQSAVTPEVTCTAVLDAFNKDMPICLGPERLGVDGAVKAITATLTAIEAAPTVRPLPRPLRADDLLPERALLGDEDARDELVDVVYGSLKGDGSDDDPTLDTIETFLKYGGALDNASRDLNVHPNTVRYRLKRAAETTGWDANDPRDAFVLRIAIILGRIRDAK